MIKISTWEWVVGCYLVKGKRRLTIGQAFILQNEDADIALACKDMLKPNNGPTRSNMWSDLYESRREDLEYRRERSRL